MRKHAEECTLGPEHTGPCRTSFNGRPLEVRSGKERRQNDYGCMYPNRSQRKSTRRAEPATPVEDGGPGRAFSWIIEQIGGNCTGEFRVVLENLLEEWKMDLPDLLADFARSETKALREQVAKLDHDASVQHSRAEKAEKELASLQEKLRRIMDAPTGQSRRNAIEDLEREEIANVLRDKGEGKS